MIIRDDMPLPQLNAYMARLPAGLQSYPTCKGKASLFRLINELQPVVDIPAALPELLRPYLRCTLPASQWVPELDYVLFSIAMDDLRGWDNDGMRRFWRRVMTHIDNSTMYGLLFRFLSARMLITTVASRWSSFHLGTTCTAVRAADGVQITLGFLHGLFPELIVHGYLGVFDALGSHSKLFKGESDLLSFNHVEARYLMRNLA